MCVRTELFGLTLVLDRACLVPLLSLLCPAFRWLLVILKCALTSCGRVDVRLLVRNPVFPFL